MKILTWMMNFHWFVQVDRTTRLFTYSPVFREFLYDKFLMYEKNPSHLYRKIADYYESSGDILNCLRQLYLLKDYKKILQGERMIKQNIISSASTPWSFIFYTLYIKL